MHFPSIDEASQVGHLSLLIFLEPKKNSGTTDVVQLHHKIRQLTYDQRRRGTMIVGISKNPARLLPGGPKFPGTPRDVSGAFLGPLCGSSRFQRLQIRYLPKYTHGFHVRMYNSKLELVLFQEAEFMHFR